MCPSPFPKGFIEEVRVCGTCPTSRYNSTSSSELVLVTITHGRGVRTLSAEGTRRLGSKPAACMLQDTELRQALISDTEQTIRRLLSRVHHGHPHGYAHSKQDTVCLTEVTDKPAPILTEVKDKPTGALLAFFPSYQHVFHENRRHVNPSPGNGGALSSTSN